MDGGKGEVGWSKGHPGQKPEAVPNSGAARECPHLERTHKEVNVRLPVF